MTTAWSHFERRIHDRAAQAGNRLSPVPIQRQLDIHSKATEELGRRSAAAVTLAIKDASDRWSRFAVLELFV